MGPDAKLMAKKTSPAKHIPGHAIRPSTWFLSWSCPLREQDRADLRHFIHQVAWFPFIIALRSYSNPVTLNKTAEKLLVDIARMTIYWCFNVLMITRYSLIWAFTHIQPLPPEFYYTASLWQRVFLGGVSKEYWECMPNYVFSVQLETDRI